MGSKKQYERLMEEMRRMYQQAQQPSPFEQQYQSEWANIGNWLNAKDYRNLPAGANVDLLPIAEYQKMRKMMRGSDSGGQVAKGANYNKLAAAQQQLGDDQFVQDWGNAYENKVGELSGRRDALGNMLQGNYANRMNLGVQGSQAMLQAFNNKPKSFWSSLLPSMIQGGASLGAAAIGRM